MKISILTYNIHKGFSSNNNQFVLHKIREQLRKLNVDIALLQEVTGENQRHSDNINDWPQCSQFEFLADEVWSHYAYGKNAVADGRHHGNAILCKYPFTDWSNINISLFRKASRSLLHGSITIPDMDKKIHLVCIHLGLFGFERRKQLQRLNQHLSSVIDEHDAVIIGGDFNDWSSRQVARYLDPALGLEEVFLKTHRSYARTFPARWPLLCVDRIYYRGLTPEKCICLNGKEWQQLSDHVPLLAQFSL